MVEVFKTPAASGQWEAAADGEPVDWEEVFRGYRSTVDWPSATFYERLAKAYPEAKVILTERDPDAWFASTQATIFARDLDPDSPDPWVRMVVKVIADLFDRRMHDRDKLISVYRAHNARVREVIPPERLLVYDVAQGWAPLCDFLGAPVPDTPMPKVNTREEFAARLAHEIEHRADAESAEPPESQCQLSTWNRRRCSSMAKRSVMPAM